MRIFKNRNRQEPAISTASLPDIVFMLLFFFMTVTTISNKTLLVENELPSAAAINKLDKKDRVIEIFVGAPKAELVEKLGDAARIQLNEHIAQVSDVGPFVLEELSKKPESIRNYVTVSLKVDKDVKVGVVADIKKELQKVNLLKVNYTTYQRDKMDHKF